MFNDYPSLPTSTYHYLVQEEKPHDNVNGYRNRIWQNPTSIHNKDFNKLGIEGNFLNLIKNIYKKLNS